MLGFALICHLFLILLPFTTSVWQDCYFLTHRKQLRSGNGHALEETLRQRRQGNGKASPGGGVVVDAEPQLQSHSLQLSAPCHPVWNICLVYPQQVLWWHLKNMERLSAILASCHSGEPQKCSATSWSCHQQKASETTQPPMPHRERGCWSSSVLPLQWACCHSVGILWLVENYNISEGELSGAKPWDTYPNLIKLCISPNSEYLKLNL